MMAKCLDLLHYILNENTKSAISKVYKVLKSESRKGDFFNIVNKDIKELQIELNFPNRFLPNFPNGFPQNFPNGFLQNFPNRFPQIFLNGYPQKNLNFEI